LDNPVAWVCSNIQLQTSIIRTVELPKSTEILHETHDADKKLLLARKDVRHYHCLFNLSLTDKVSQMALYNGKTTELPVGEAANVWKNIFKHFNANKINKINKINELKGEFVKNTIYSAETNPYEWFEELYFIFWRLEDGFKCNTFGDIEMMTQSINNTKPAAYQMQLTLIKDQLNREVARFLKEANYVREVTLETVMDESRSIFE
jgi:hypothetical protein